MPRGELGRKDDRTAEVTQAWSNFAPLSHISPPAYPREGVHQE